MAERKIFLSVCIVLFFTTSTVHAQKPAHRIDMPSIGCLNATLPITFSWIEFDYPQQDVPVKVREKIKQVILDDYLEANGGDSTELFKAKDTYFNTLCAQLDKHQLYIVMLKTPLSYMHCKLFLYDSASNAVSKKTVDYNTWAMYSIEEGTIKRSELYKGLQLDSDDIILTKKKQSLLLLKRIKHNGTSNELEEITYKPNGISLDTVSFKSKILD